MEPIIFLIGLFVIGLIAGNSQLMIAIAVLFVLRWFPFGKETIFPYLRQNGITIGVLIMTISVLIPIATGDMGLKELSAASKSYTGWVALASGIIVSLLARNGIGLLAEDPTVTVALVVGTILAVSFFKGVAVGPMIGAGIAYWLMMIFSFVKR